MIKKNFLYELYGCYHCPFRVECQELWKKTTGQAGNYTFKEADGNCPKVLEDKFSYNDVNFEELESGGKILPNTDKDNIDNCRPEIRFWKELNKWSVKFYYADDGGYDMYFARIFFNSKEEVVNWLTEYEE